MSGGRRASEAYVGDRHFVITPSNAAVDNWKDTDATGNLGGLTPINACVMVCDAGPVTVALVDTHNTVVTYTVSGPFVIPTKAVRVNSTGTTATNLIGIW